MLDAMSRIKEDAKKWESFYTQEVTPEFLFENICVHRIFFKEILKGKPRRVLEVGIGTGTMSLFLSMLGIECVGIDNNDEIVKRAMRASKALGRHIIFQKANAAALPFEDRSFDIVFSQGFFEHFSDTMIIKLLSEQLRVGSDVILSVPNNFYPQKDVGDERLLSKEYWDHMLMGNFNLVHSENYYEFSRRVKGFWGDRIERFSVMYMAKIAP